MKKQKYYRKESDTLTEVTKFIEDGRTRFVEDELEAMKVIKEKGCGYYYPVYNDEGKTIGFGIPK